ncbi:type II glyceraldehyde-3-phosphate dehydrogenase [Arthrobacter sp. H16F315]|nr:type II glyceraldehyde-3-phosphate dehydrogenase [Arthrobacter sp. H16F315]
MEVSLRAENLRIRLQPCSAPAVRIGVEGIYAQLAGGEDMDFPLVPKTAKPSGLRTAIEETCNRTWKGIPMTKTRVAVNGYGVIGKRVADAVLLQPDMELIGVADIITDWRIRSAAGRFPLFASTAEARDAMGQAGLTISGDLADLLAQADVVVDATPKHVAAGNLPRYRAAGVKVVMQGGESHDTTGHSFVAQANYDSALGRDMTRVVSCNTTSIVRVLGALQDAGLLAKARGVLIRRATDPWESHLGGIMNTMVPEPKIPSHQGPDARTVLPGLDVVTIAAKGAHTQTHNHYWTLQLTRPSTREEDPRGASRGPAHRVHPDG